VAAASARRMLPTELARILNSTPLGAVTTGPRVRRHVEQAGFRVGDGRTVDLLRYAAWLFDRCHGPRAVPPVRDESMAYEQKREAMAARSSRQSRSGRDIGKLPPPVDPERKAACGRDFRLYCESYLAPLFPIAWSADHIRVIGIIQTAVLEGGLFAFAMPRGMGKTTIVEAAVGWALLYGHRRFVALIGSSETHAETMLANITSELSTNDLLLADFPEVCVALERLEGIAQRANGQLCQGERTHVDIGQKVLVLPTIAASAASGGIVRVAGITGGIRGMSFRRPDGTKSRPDFVALDDPQTDESARSPSQCRRREQILSGAILGLAGPGAELSGFMPCTVVQPSDFADSILSREKHPEWQGERFRLVYDWPTNTALWDEYSRLRRESFANGGRGETATKFYLKKRKAMDAGARVAWPERRKKDELSALQHAWNLRIDRGEEAFFAEYQNDPIPDVLPSTNELSAADVAKKLNGIARGLVPEGCSQLTMFIDVQGKLLYWLVAAWEDNFTGYVVDYGTWPDQKLEYFTLREAKRTISAAIAKRTGDDAATARPGIAGSIYYALDRLCEEQLGREFRQDGGAVMRIGRCLVDANWGTSTETVYQFARQSRFAQVVMPSHGRYVGAASTPFSEYSRKTGDRVGLRWRIPAPKGRRAIRHVLSDINWWKTFAHDRLAVPMGDPGCWSLFGAKPAVHQMLADQLVAETRVAVEARGRTVDEWRLKQPHLDNHFLDCLVGAAVAASMLGVSPGSSVEEAPTVRRRIRLSEIQRAR